MRYAYGGAQGEVAAEAHACCADAACASGQGEEVVDRLVGVLVVGLEGLPAMSTIYLNTNTQT